jgi:hypothetical protein
MFRIWCSCVLATIVVFGQSGRTDAAFDKIPFEEWLKGGGEAPIRWSIRIFPARLSQNQRLEEYIWIEVDSAELLNRHERDQLIAFLEIRDQSNRVYRTQCPLNLEKGTAPTEQRSVRSVQLAYVLPGDYVLTAAVYDTVSKQHNLKQMRWRVPELVHDPLPGAWRDLPAVDFSGQIVDNPPRLYLPVKSRRPVHIELVVNEGIYPDTISRLIPQLFAISQMEVLYGSMNVTLLDLDRQKVRFSQEVGSNLNWRRLLSAMNASNSNRVDARVLEHSKEAAQFFVSEVRKRLERSESDDRERVVIVLSAPRRLPRGEDLRPIQATLQTGSRVFYVRSYPPPYGPGELLPPYPVEPHLNDDHEGPANTPTYSEAHLRRQRIEGSADSLEPTLKPLAPHVFNVTTPEQFRNALAKIMTEISQQK